MFITARVLPAILTVGIGAARVVAQVAITEFINNPDGADQGREWVELYNFGPSDVCLTGWTVADEGTDLFALPDVTIASGGYVVLVSGGVPGFRGVDAATAEAMGGERKMGTRGAPSRLERPHEVHHRPDHPLFR